MGLRDADEAAVVVGACLKRDGPLRGGAFAVVGCALLAGGWVCGEDPLRRAQQRRVPSGAYVPMSSSPAGPYRSTRPRTRGAPRYRASWKHTPASVNHGSLQVSSRMSRGSSKGPALPTARSAPGWGRRPPSRAGGMPGSSSAVRHPCAQRIVKSGFAVVAARGGSLGRLGGVLKSLQFPIRSTQDAVRAGLHVSCVCPVRGSARFALRPARFRRGRGTPSAVRVVGLPCEKMQGGARSDREIDRPTRRLPSSDLTRDIHRVRCGDPGRDERSRHAVRAASSRWGPGRGRGRLSPSRRSRCHRVSPAHDRPRCCQFESVRLDQAERWVERQAPGRGRCRGMRSGVAGSSRS